MLVNFFRIILAGLLLAGIAGHAGAPESTANPFAGARLDPEHPTVIILKDFSRIAATPERLARIRAGQTSHGSATAPSVVHQTTATIILPKAASLHTTDSLNNFKPTGEHLFLSPTYARPTPQPRRTIITTVPALPYSDTADPTVLITRGGTKYHRPGCTLVHSHNTMLVPLSAARAGGYSACSKCILHAN